VTDIGSCDGSSNPVFTDLQCTIPMISFWLNSLVLYDLIEVRVTATNSLDTSVASPVNTVGATVRTKPALMADPTEGTNTSESQI